ncbi:MAG: hypothetical protein R3F43_01490 [bacterium]
MGCGWADGGNDAFDCYGTIGVTFNGQASGALDATIAAAPRQGAAGAYAFRYTSELVGNVWRFKIMPAVENDDRPVTVTLTGNLGSDGATQGVERQTAFQGRALRYYHTSDNFGAPGDPPVYHFWVPSDPEQLAAVSYVRANDNMTITARDVTLPITLYTALHYGADQAAWDGRRGGADPRHRDPGRRRRRQRPAVRQLRAVGHRGTVIPAGIACALAGAALLVLPPPVPASLARQGRWAAVSVLLAALCTANAHAPDRGDAWWGVLLLLAVAAGAALRWPNIGARLALRLAGLALAAGGGLLLAGLGSEGASLATGATFVASAGGLCAGFRLQAILEKDQ